jgi:hypothetical protein
VLSEYDFPSEIIETERFWHFVTSQIGLHADISSLTIEILFSACSDAEIANQVGNDLKHGGRAAGDGLSCNPQ